MNRISIMPAGFSMSFRVYRCETKPGEIPGSKGD